MAKMSKADRVTQIEALIKVSPITDAELAAAQATLDSKAPFVEFSGKAPLIPMQGGRYGYTTSVKASANGKETSASVTFMHPDADEGVTRAHAALHQLALNRVESLKSASAKPATLADVWAAASEADKLAFIAMVKAAG